MSRAKTTLLYSAVIAFSTLAFAGFAIRQWLKSNSESAGSPQSFVTQLAIKSLTQKLAAHDLTISEADRARIKSAIAVINANIRQINRDETLALFSVVGTFTKIDPKAIRKKDIDALVFGLESIARSIHPRTA